MEFNKWIHEYGSDDEIHNWEHDMEHDTGADAEIGWDILQILTQAGFMGYSLCQRRENSRCD